VPQVLSASFFLTSGLTWLTPKHEEFLAQYEREIQIKVDSAFKDIHERQDVKQEIRVELIKAYKNRLKYADWHYVVLNAIKCRIKDYKKRLYKVPLFDVTIKDKQSADTLIQYILDTHMSDDLEAETVARMYSIETSDLLESLLSLFAWCEEDFTEWEKEYMSWLYGKYTDDKNYPLENEKKRMELMGYGPEDRKEFRQLAQQFTDKIKEMINDNWVV